MTRLALCLLLLANLAGCQPDCWSSDPDECRAEREQARANAEREKMSRGYSVESLTSSIDVIHDDKRSVTCWRYAAGNAGGLSCIADWIQALSSCADSSAPVAARFREHFEKILPVPVGIIWSEADQNYEKTKLSCSPMSHLAAYQNAWRAWCARGDLDHQASRGLGGAV